MSNNIKQIYDYDDLSDDKLIEQAHITSSQVPKPKLNAMHALKNFVISATAIGFGVASTVGFWLNMRNPSEDKGFTSKLSEFINIIGKKDERQAFEDQNPKFKRVLYLSTKVFAAVTALSIPVVAYFQRSEQAEDNATKYLYAKDELFRRGYMLNTEGEYIKMETSQKIREQQKDLTHRVIELENKLSFREKELAKSQVEPSQSALIH